MLPERNNPTRANAAIVTATTTSSSVKPRSRRNPRSAAVVERGSPVSGPIGHAHPSAKPIDADGDAALAIADRDAASGRAAVGVETDIACGAGAPFAGNRQELDRQPAG